MNEIYIQIGENKYPVALNAIIQRQDPVDRSWTNWHHITISNFAAPGDMTEYGKQVFQESLANGQCQVTVYTGTTPAELASRRKPMRNTRIQRVQAKRKAMDLGKDGKCCGLRTRKASLALRKEEQDFYNGKRAEQPLISEFERVPARRRRRWELTLMHSLLTMSHTEAEWVRAMAQLAQLREDYERALIVTPEELGELSNVNKSYNKYR